MLPHEGRGEGICPALGVRDSFLVSKACLSGQMIPTDVIIRGSDRQEGLD